MPPRKRPYVVRRIDPDTLAFSVAGQCVFFGIAALINPVLFVLTSLRHGIDLEAVPFLWGGISILIGAALFTLRPGAMKRYALLAAVFWWAWVTYNFVSPSPTQPQIATGLAIWGLIISCGAYWRSWIWGP
jgi:hypothetical protein